MNNVSYNVSISLKLDRYLSEGHIYVGLDFTACGDRTLACCHPAHKCRLRTKLVDGRMIYRKGESKESHNHPADGLEAWKKKYVAARLSAEKKAAKRSRVAVEGTKDGSSSAKRGRKRKTDAKDGSPEAEDDGNTGTKDGLSSGAKRGRKTGPKKGSSDEEEGGQKTGTKNGPSSARRGRKTGTNVGSSDTKRGQTTGTKDGSSSAMRGRKTRRKTNPEPSNDPATNSE
jgi:hypothetical protein